MAVEEAHTWVVLNGYSQIQPKPDRWFVCLTRMHQQSLQFGPMSETQATTLARHLNDLQKFVEHGEGCTWYPSITQTDENKDWSPQRMLAALNAMTRVCSCGLGRLV